MGATKGAGRRRWLSSDGRSDVLARRRRWMPGPRHGLAAFMAGVSGQAGECRHQCLRMMHAQALAAALLLAAVPAAVAIMAIRGFMCDRIAAVAMAGIGVQMPGRRSIAVAAACRGLMGSGRCLRCTHVHGDGRRCAADAVEHQREDQYPMAQPSEHAATLTSRCRAVRSGRTPGHAAVRPGLLPGRPRGRRHPRRRPTGAASPG